MKCLSCGLEAGFSRLIVNVNTDSKEGSLCSSCESKLDRVPPDESSDDAPRCLECGESGVFALPEMQLSIVDDDHGDKFTYEYDLDADTPHLCPAHLETLLQEPRGVDPLDMLDDRI